MERGLLCSTVPSKGPGRDGALLLGIVAFLAFCRQQEPQGAQLAPAFWAVQHKATTAEAERETRGRGKRKVAGGREEVPASARCLLSLFIFWLSEFTAETEARNEAAACTARAAWARKTFAPRVEKIKKYGKAENAWRKTRAELHAWKMIFGN